MSRNPYTNYIITTNTTTTTTFTTSWIIATSTVAWIIATSVATSIVTVFTLLVLTGDSVVCRQANSGIVDPKSKSGDEIDEVMELAPEFQGMKVERFRDNFKSCATEYMTTKAITGIRRSEFYFNFLYHYS